MPTGLIPAHAGKTTAPTSVTIWTRAHPRSRGENVRYDPLPCTRRGSSPLTRGKRATNLRCHVIFRLIPAHAGKTPESGRSAPTCGAHPRSRGENKPGVTYSLESVGSSPLTRGKQHVRRDVDRVLRLIPAHAGKTVGQYTRRTGVPAHPRSRGENAFESAGGAQGIGSSPLTRGKPLLPTAPQTPEGLIPAHAGKTLRGGA